MKAVRVLTYVMTAVLWTGAVLALGVALGVHLGSTRDLTSTAPSVWLNVGLAATQAALATLILSRMHSYHEDMKGHVSWACGEVAKTVMELSRSVGAAINFRGYLEGRAVDAEETVAFTRQPRPRSRRPPPEGPFGPPNQPRRGPGPEDVA